VRGTILALTVLVATPGVAAEPGAPAESITIALGGDVYVDAPTRAGLQRRAAARGGFEAHRELLADVAPVLAGADLSIVNLETPVARRRRERRPGEPPIFAASEHFVAALVDAGVDAASLANNHAYDQGHVGLRETLAAARRAKLAVAGAGRSRGGAAGPVLLATPGGLVGLCSWTQSVNVRPFDEPEDGASTDGVVYVALVRDGTLSRCLETARARAALTVAALHLTTAEWTGPGPEERALAQAAVDAGADVVVGHGPHVPGPARWVDAADGRRALVLYSMGNLVGAMGGEGPLFRRRRVGVRDAAVVLLRAARRPGGRLAVTELDVHPFWIADEDRRALGWPAGQLLTRPLSIVRERERLAAAGCGQRCAARSEALARRAAALADAFSTGNASAPDIAGLARADRAGRPAPARAAAGPTTGGEREPRAAGAAVAPTARVDDLVLPLRFGRGGVAAEVVDERALERIVAMVQARRSARVVLTGFGADGEDGADALAAERLGVRRARAAMWIVTSRGPSRSRFDVRGGEPGGEARVVLSLAP
jgi:poly-gamma-glutamate synthesis protein (capsule biosynthesis protein)